MVNGSISRILYIGALFLVGLCLVGKMILSYFGKETGSDVTIVLTSLVAFLFGTHVTPLLKPDQVARTLENTLKEATNSKSVHVSLVANDEQTDR